MDTDPRFIVHGTFAEGIVNAVAEHEPSFVLIGQRTASVAPALGSPAEAVAASIASPVAIVIGESERIHGVLLLDGQPRRDGAQNGAADLAAELATRIGGKRVTTIPAEDPPPFSDIASGQLAIAPSTFAQTLALADPTEGAAVVMVLDPQPPAATTSPSSRSETPRSDSPAVAAPRRTDIPEGRAH